PVARPVHPRAGGGERVRIDVGPPVERGRAVAVDPPDNVFVDLGVIEVLQQHQDGERSGGRHHEAEWNPTLAEAAYEPAAAEVDRLGGVAAVVVDALRLGEAREDPLELEEV